MRRIVITGAMGMLGHRLAREFSVDNEVHAIIRSTDPQGHLSKGPLAGVSIHGGIDLTDYQKVEDALGAIKPDVLINGAGLIKQKLDGDLESRLQAVNEELPQRLGALGEKLGFKFVNVSTDCVFSGSRGQYSESDTPDCTDEYGLTKLRGEQCGPAALVLRTSIIGRELKGASGLLEWFLSNSGKTVKGFTNAFFSGLTTTEFARVLKGVLNDNVELKGLYHVAGERIGKAELLGLANEIFAVGAMIEPVDEPFIDRSLDGRRFNAVTGYAPPSWRTMLEEVATQSGYYETWRTQKF
jgi:dTDP-4-dehydrorhamnose reductase